MKETPYFVHSNPIPYPRLNAILPFPNCACTILTLNLSRPFNQEPNPIIPFIPISEPPADGIDGQIQPGGGLAAVYDIPEGAARGDRPMARAMMAAGLVAAPSRACRRPKRRKTSEIVTRMEMMMRTMMIQVWSVGCGLV
jgi:hypothetical protein